MVRLGFKHKFRFLNVKELKQARETVQQPVAGTTGTTPGTPHSETDCQQQYAKVTFRKELPLAKPS